MTVNVNSEIGRLKMVLIHKPDEGIGRISPRRAEELLFDDIVHLPKMQEEHDTFVQVLNHFVGKDNVKEVAVLLEEALAQNPDKKNSFIDWIIDFEELPKSYGDDLKELNTHDLARDLITGHLKSKDYILFDPIPNFIFTRDIAVTIKDHILITKAAKEARHRENLFTRFIIYHHPFFNDLVKEDRIINLNNIERFPPSKKGQNVSLEGGDMMMLNNDFLLVGTSERTTAHAFNSIKDVIFEKGLVDNVVQINIPNERSFMHIDTLFTRISETDVAAYKPIIYDGLSSNVIVHRSSGDQEIYSSVREFFWGEINRDTRFIFAGNGKSPYQEREQWTDGSNLVALKPGVAVAYDRNPYTDVAFRSAGYEIIEAKELLRQLESGETSVDKVEKTIINIESNELSRARGGSHCMTCPVVRENIQF